MDQWEETVWQKQANIVKEKEADNDRQAAGIRDGGSDRDSMSYWDNRQIDEFCRGREVKIVK